MDSYVRLVELVIMPFNIVLIIHIRLVETTLFFYELGFNEQIVALARSSLISPLNANLSKKYHSSIPTRV